MPVILRVLHHSEALDRRHGDGLQPGEEAERDSGDAAEREMGNLAVPPATGYMAPSSAWTSAMMTTIAPAIAQASRAAVPAAEAA